MSTISKSMQIMPPNTPWRRDPSFAVIESFVVVEVKETIAGEALVVADPRRTP
jgi:hypothetical protein